MWQRYGRAILLGSLLIVVLGAGYFFSVVKKIVNIPLIDRDPTEVPRTATNDTGLPLFLPPGFSITTYADGLDGPRVLIPATTEIVLVSDIRASTIIALPNNDGDGQADQSVILAENLQKPHGLVFISETELVIAEEHLLSLWRFEPEPLKLTFQKTLIDLPTGGSHVTRTVAQGLDGKLFVAIGSTCNVCLEPDERNAAILRLNPDGTGLERWAWGLRNTVFFTLNPKNPTEFWGNDMGRDLLGDNLPPDELNQIPATGTPPGNYGWPICYGNNIHDTNFDTTTVYKRNPCLEPFEHGSFFDYPAHIAPLGLAFIPEGKNWPKDWEGDLLVSFHGSWNSAEKVGYKVVRLELDAEQQVVATHDFLTGFLTDDDRVIGRPAGLLIDTHGQLFIADDGAGRIFRVVPLTDDL